MGAITTGSNTFTIDSSCTASTGAPPVAEENPTPQDEFGKLVEGMRFTEPQMLPPKRYGSCMRCSISVDVSAFQGRCSACGGPLSNR